MRITLPAKKIANARVTGCWVGSTPAEGIWVGEHKIWPDDSAARKIRVQLPEEGTLDWAYWTHALDSINYGASASRYIKVEIGDKLYYLNESADSSYPLELNGNVIDVVEFEEVAIGSIGESLKVRLKLPQRVSATVSDSSADLLPVLPGTILHGGVAKGQKKVSPGIEMAVSALPSGQLFYYRNFQQNGHGRGNFYYDFASLPWVNGSVKTRLATTLRRTSKGGAWFIYPAFERSIELPVISVS